MLDSSRPYLLQWRQLETYIVIRRYLEKEEKKSRQLCKCRLVVKSQEKKSGSCSHNPINIILLLCSFSLGKSFSIC